MITLREYGHHPSWSQMHAVQMHLPAHQSAQIVFPVEDDGMSADIWYVCLMQSPSYH